VRDREHDDATRLNSGNKRVGEPVEEYTPDPWPNLRRLERSRSDDLHCSLDLCNEVTSRMRVALAIPSARCAYFLASARVEDDSHGRC
jgi:hypothetical protein